MNGDYNQAITNYLKAAEIYQAFSPITYANEIWCVASGYQSWGNQRQAEYYFRKVLRMNKRHVRDKGVTAHFRIAQMERARGRLLETKLHLDSAETYMCKLSPDHQMIINLERGLLHLESGDNQKALAYITHVQRQNERYKLPVYSTRGEFEVDYALYLYYRKNRRPEKAGFFLEQALDNARRIQANHLRLKYLKELVAFYSNHDNNHAIRYFRAYNTLNDSIAAAANEHNVSYYESVLQEKDFRRNQAVKDALAQAELSKKKRENIYLGLGLALLLLITLTTAFFLRFTQRSKKHLEQQKLRAEQAERYKQQFLANMSHEIRTPMNAVLGMTHLLLDTPVSPRQQAYLTAIRHSSENLLVIINDILDLSKLEAGKMELEQVAFRITDVVQQVAETMRFKAEEKGLLLLTDISHHVPPVVIGDPGRLYQVLINLVGNAIKFTQKGKVRLLADQTEQGTCFRVADTGIGIPEDKLHKLFEAFTQADAGTTRQYGGTGLGLSISKTLVELHGGHITVKSEEGAGAEFSFVIPYKAGTEAMLPQEAQPVNHASLRGIRVLVAEDNEYNQVVVVDSLHNLVKDVQIEVAENGKIALQKLEAHDYDVILMDANMPKWTAWKPRAASARSSPNRSATFPSLPSPPACSQPISRSASKPA